MRSTRSTNAAVLVLICVLLVATHAADAARGGGNSAGQQQDDSLQPNTPEAEDEQQQEASPIASQVTSKSEVEAKPEGWWTALGALPLAEFEPWFLKNSEEANTAISAHAKENRMENLFNAIYEVDWQLRRRRAANAIIGSKADLGKFWKEKQWERRQDQVKEMCTQFALVLDDKGADSKPRTRELALMHEAQPVLIDALKKGARWMRTCASSVHPPSECRSLDFFSIFHRMAACLGVDKAYRMDLIQTNECRLAFEVRKHGKPALIAALMGSMLDTTSYTPHSFVSYFLEQKDHDLSLARWSSKYYSSLAVYDALRRYQMRKTFKNPVTNSFFQMFYMQYNNPKDDVTAVVGKILSGISGELIAAVGEQVPHADQLDIAEKLGWTSRAIDYSVDLVAKEEKFKIKWGYNIVKYSIKAVQFLVGRWGDQSGAIPKESLPLPGAIDNKVTQWMAKAGKAQFSPIARFLNGLRDLEFAREMQKAKTTKEAFKKFVQLPQDPAFETAFERGVADHKEDEKDM